MGFVEKKAQKIPKKTLDQATPIQAAVLADIMMGGFIGKTARKYGIDGGTVRWWMRQFDVELATPATGAKKPIGDVGAVVLAPGAGADLPTNRVALPNSNAIDPVTGEKKPMGQQLMELLENSIGALSAQLAVASDPRWIERQNAADLAALYRTVGDRAVELAAAAAAGAKREAEYHEEDREDVGPMVGRIISHRSH